nr:AAA family ATPase [Desulfobulbaceae bacterium]
MIHRQPQIFVFFGMIATGKSTLAKMWAKAHEMFYYNSDVVRKEIAGSAAQRSDKSSFGQGIYSSGFSQKTYACLLDKAETAVKSGQSVVLDASYSSIDNRQQVIALADKYSVTVCFIFCTCLEDEMRTRMEKRAQDPLAVSDGRWEIYLQQKESFESLDHLGDQLITINTVQSPERLFEELKTRCAS